MDVVIKKEKEDGGSDSHGSWLDLASDKRTCEWCSAPDDMRNQLPNYVKKPLDDWYRDLLLDLCYCFDCVQEYHRLQEELDDDSKKILNLVDIQRLAKTITHALNNAGETDVLQDIATHLQVPLLEILKFPYLLHHKQLADLFTKGLIALNVCGCPLKLGEFEEKLPGTYMLLVHHDPEVRGWAVRSVRGQGFINQDDYDVLKQVIKWMIEVIEFNLFENSDLMTSESRPFEYMGLPTHLFINLTLKEYWLGLFVLLRQMDMETMQSCFMSFTGHHEFLNIIVLPMENQEHMEDDGAFWPRLQCFIVLLERLGIRIWQISINRPDQLFTIITENYSFHNAVMHWQSSEDEEASSQEMVGDLSETRTLSGSSVAKHSSRFCKTALAWFQPFVRSVLDIDCLSLVINYLHNLAGGCSHENTFKSDVQSVLLGIIHELLALGKFELLVPTVHVWAIDVVDVVIELGDEKIVEGTRRLIQHLLKASHRMGSRKALKYWQKFSLPGSKPLSTEDKQEIISLLVQSFEAQHNPAFQGTHSSHGSKAPVINSSCGTKASVVLPSSSLKTPVIGSSCSTKASLVLPNSCSKAPASFSTPAPFTTAPMAQTRHGSKVEWVTTSKNEMDSKTSHQSGLRTQQTLPLKEVKVEKSPGKGDTDFLAVENRGKAPHGNLQSYEEPGPSTRSTTFEDEETGFWAYRKRDKKPKHPSGNVRISKSSQTLKGTPIHAKLQLEDCKASIRKVKTETSIGKRAYQATTQPKKTQRAMKSAGMTKKHTPTQQNSGATSEDAIVLSDDDEGAAELSEQKESTSTRVKGAGIPDALLQMSTVEHESPLKAIETSSTVQDTSASRSPGDVSSEPNSSDDELLISYLESTNKDLKSVEPSEHYSVSQIKTERTDFNTTYSTSIKDVVQEGFDVMDYDNETDDFALLETRTLASRAKTRPLSGIQKATVSNSPPKADFSSDSDDEPLSSAAARWASKSTNVKTSSSVVASKLRNEETVSESRTASFDEVINTTSRDTSRHKADFPLIETEVECHDSVFAEANEITRELDCSVKWNSDAEGESYEMEIQTVKPEPAEEGEDGLSLSSISRQLENAYFMDDGIDDYYLYSKLVVNSQENALARLEEDLDDLYSTQIENLAENDTIMSSPCANDTAAVPDEALPNAIPKKRVTFADEPSSTDTVTSPRPSVSQAAITKPTRALSEHELFHDILNWKAERLLHLQSNGRPATYLRNAKVDRVPNSFDSMDHYYKTFKPLLLMEIWEQAISSWWDKHLNRKRVVMDVLDGSNANSFWLIPCSGVINEHQQRNGFFPMESDLVLLTLADSDGRGGSSEQSYSGRSVFGFVEKIDVNRVQSPRRVSLGSSGGEDEPSEVKFQLTLNIKTSCNFRPVRNCRIQVKFVSSLLTTLRQWSGLMHFSKSILASDILRPRKADYFCSVDYSQSSHVAKEYNESQEKVISTAANAVHKPFPIPRICLVQGPPGTGKSFTIVGLVKEILNRAQDMPAQSTPGPSNGSLANKVRILLCGPSNAAIDELIGRIREAQIQLDKRHDNKENQRHNRQNDVKTEFSNNCGDLCLVRVGRKSHIHPSAMKFSLDSMTKQILEKASTSTTEDNLNSIKEKLKSTAAAEKKLQHEIWILQTSPQSNAHELERLETEKAKLIKLKNNLEQQYRAEKTKKANKRRKESRIRKEILQCADVICTTLSGAGSSSLKQDLAGRRVCPFTCVIVDEACQCNELDLLIPLWFQASKLVLVGDPEQLPSTVLSMKAKEKLYGRSMFERLYRFFRHHKEEMGKPVLMLEEQYRMHPEIAAFPSSHVYNNCLKSHSSLEKRPFPLAKHYALFDVFHGGEISQDRGALWNPAEVDLIVKLCLDLTKILHMESVGIITPYRQQKGEIQSRLVDEGLSRGDATIEVNTVDGFQGREKDIIILSCVRAQNYFGSIGFLSDKQRMNVALTRARHALYVFGHMKTLKRGSPDWKALVDDAEERHCLFPVESSRKVWSVLSIGFTNDIQSPAKDPRLKTKYISDGHAAESGKLIVDSSHSTMQEHEKHGKEGVRYRDRHQKETREVPRHRPRSTDHRSDPHRHEHRDSRKRDHRHRNHHRPDQNNRAPVESKSNRTQREHSRYHSSHRDRDRVRERDCDQHDRDHRDRDRERVEGSAFQRRQMEPGQNNTRTDTVIEFLPAETTASPNETTLTRVPYPWVQPRGETTVSRFPNPEVSRRVETTVTSVPNPGVQPGQNNTRPDTVTEFLPAETTASPNETTLTRVPYPWVQPRGETTVSRVPNPEVSRRVETTVTSVPNPGVQPGQNNTRPDTVTEFSPAETTASPSETTLTRVPYPWGQPRGETTVSRVPNPEVSRRVETTVTSVPNPGVQPGQNNTRPDTVTEFSPAETTASPNETTLTRVPYPWGQPRGETTVSRVPNPEVSKRVETTVTSVPNPGVQPRVEATVSGIPNPGVQPRFEITVSEAPNPDVSISDTPNPLASTITQHRFSSYSLAAPVPSTSNATHSNAISRRPSGAAASSFSTSSGPDTSQPSTSFGVSRSLDRRGSRAGELDPGAQRALDIVRPRYPPVKGPPVIPATSVWNPYGGSRKRKAHADTEVSSLRQRGSGGSSLSAKRSAVGPPRKTFQETKKKFQENFRGRKSWE